MRVLGFDVTDEHESLALTQLRCRGGLTHTEMAAILMRANVIPAYRAADRLTQKWRKNGAAVFNGKKWIAT